MRIHTSTLTEDDVRQAAKIAGVGVYRLGRHGSRKRDHAFDVIIEEMDGRRGNSGKRGASGDYYAASWDAWGVFLAELFRRDDTMTVPGTYHSAEHFHWATTDRFREDVTEHRNHRWQYVGESLTGTYITNECRGCGAQQRWCAADAWERISGDALAY